METAKQQTATVSIGGMSCSGCANTVQKALNELAGVEKATVNLNDEAATVTYDPDAASEDDFQQAIDKAGYIFIGIN
jgi:copper chaperone CopZ